MKRHIAPKLLIAASCVALLSGCSDPSSELGELIKPRLKDPDSLKITQTTSNSESTRACVLWNAKNSFGGYGQPSVTSFKKSSTGWAIAKWEADVEKCSQAYFDALDAYYEYIAEFKDIKDKLPPETASEIQSSITMLNENMEYVSLNNLVTVLASWQVLVDAAKE